MCLTGAKASLTDLRDATQSPSLFEGDFGGP